ncbi:protein arginine N-methyltransferase 1-B [Stomoxys calcitrans]|uniref:protein arginine N-methyltransferase 1-B n=1 Tax=Stomoxys calcitrans TaxID=35570 RepID=UPI0027E38167|nr:protein arginine N-methyltransferase 1-B [Stomoxys calcitrans]
MSTVNKTVRKKKQKFNKKPDSHKTNVDVNDDGEKQDSDSGNATASTTLTITYPSPVDLMTSKDFQFDVKAHVEMIHQHLKDKVRVLKYKEAILLNRHLFKGKIVLDINCGIGIYSMFAAKAGAAKVYAVERSNVVYYAEKIVSANGYDDVIDVLKGNIQQIELPVKEVDIIISEWMGYAMLFQATCEDVIYARDKWLRKPGGLIFPDQAKLFINAVEDRKHKNENIDWWKGVYGFNMQCLREVALKEPRHQLIKPKQILSKQCPLKLLDLNTATRDDLKFRSKFMLPIERAGQMDGICLYFHVYFTKSHTPLGFSTDPWSPGTNWMQTILFLDTSLTVQPNSMYYGGIEMFSRKTPPDMCDMIINLEMLKGDPAAPDVDMEMSWNFKPITAPIEPLITSEETLANSTAIDNPTAQESNVLEKNRNVASFDYPSNLETNNLEDFTFSPMNKSQHSTTPALQYPKGSRTFTLGDQIYVCRKQRRNKKKNTKKG